MIKCSVAVGEIIVSCEVGRHGTNQFVLEFHVVENPHTDDIVITPPVAVRVVVFRLDPVTAQVLRER